MEKLEHLPDFLDTLKSITAKSALKEGVGLANMVRTEQLEAIKDLPAKDVISLRNAIWNEWSRNVQEAMTKSHEMDRKERVTMAQLAIEGHKAGLS